MHICTVVVGGCSALPTIDSTRTQVQEWLNTYPPFTDIKHRFAKDIDDIPGGNVLFDWSRENLQEICSGKSAIASTVYSALHGMRTNPHAAHTNSSSPPPHATN
jgi:hypothetical protein